MEVMQTHHTEMLGQAVSTIPVRCFSLVIRIYMPLLPKNMPQSNNTSFSKLPRTIAIYYSAFVCMLPAGESRRREDIYNALFYLLVKR